VGVKYAEAMAHGAPERKFPEYVVPVSVDGYLINNLERNKRPSLNRRKEYPCLP
jgi:hypothetical protein